MKIKRFLKILRNLREFCEPDSETPSSDTREPVGLGIARVPNITYHMA